MTFMQNDERKYSVKMTNALEIARKVERQKHEKAALTPDKRELKRLYVTF